ncbi:uncharacterized protein CCR75_003283 [Bremia lactucae]|uniref:tRNA (adenine(58)-N(1))-methyltransferase non-catalytic subunit TRM6 n=1 Tax=Bremia lactucae TaxID=4779 RepID=A0A976NYA7_BRELC|nr:hypothetical protein CCR75_003283 [Bremia lactucae]
MALAVDASTSRLPYLIYENDTVICQTSDGRMFFQAIARGDTIFEEQNKKLVKVTGGLFPDPVAPETGEGFALDGDNRHYADTNSAQTLKQTDIGELREQGVSGQEIIQKLVENSSTWKTKTEFSKQKYLKKKQKKYMPRVRFLRCTAESLCRTYRLKNPSKICNLREDSLGQMLVYGNVFAGGQVLVVDTCMGLVAGAIAERQGGSGSIICLYEGQQPAADILRRFNFGNVKADGLFGNKIPLSTDKRTLESIHYMPFKHIRMLEMNEEAFIEPAQLARDGMTQEERERLAAERAKSFTPEQQKRYADKKALRELTKLNRQKPATIRKRVREKSDSLIIAANFDPEKILMALLPYLDYSKPFVIYSEFLEPLTSTFATLQKMEAIIDLQLNETWTRENQILPGRTHPEMNMSACSGYLLSGIKISDIPPLGTSIIAQMSREDSGNFEPDKAPALKKQKAEETRQLPLKSQDTDMRRFLNDLESKRLALRCASTSSSSQQVGRVVVITSGKGGVGKTTVTASMGYGLAQRGFRTCLIDFDIGLRNLDLHLGCERRVIFDFIHVIEKNCRLNQALIKDKRLERLSLLAASQTRDKEALTVEGVEDVLDELKTQFDYILCDSPAGIESGARHAMYFADDAILVTNPEISSCRDSDKMIGFIASKSLRAEEGREPVKQRLLVNRYDANRVKNDDCLSVDDIEEMLGLPVYGVIPESAHVLTSSNMGQPVITAKNEHAAVAFEDAVARFLGEEREMKFLQPEPPKGLFTRFFS